MGDVDGTNSDGLSAPTSEFKFELVCALCTEVPYGARTIALPANLLVFRDDPNVTDELDEFITLPTGESFSEDLCGILASSLEELQAESD